MKISFHNIGCKVNYAETAAIASQFSAEGWDLVPFGEPADLVVINTCTVTKKADADSRKYIRRAVRDNPGAFVVVTGCGAQLRHEEIAAIEGVGAVLGNEEKFDIPQIIDGLERQTLPILVLSDMDSWAFHPASSAEDAMRTRVFLKVQDGCDYKCAFCTVPLARGRSRSMNPDKLLKLLNKLEGEGVREVILSGINLGEYRHGETDFTALLKHIVALADNVFRMRFRISSIEPNLISDEIISLVAGSELLCPHFHIPLQSGSDEILNLMRRRYHTGLFSEKIEKIMTLITDCCLGIDVITGFPGETDRHFQETFDFIDSLPASYLHVFTYSEREGTEAASMPGAVPERIRKERTIALRELSVNKLEQFYRSQAKTVRKVIPESYMRSKDLWTGWTENYVRAAFRLDEKTREPLKVRLREYAGDYVLAEKL